MSKGRQSKKGSKPQVVMYSSRICPFCFRAKSLFDSKKIKIDEIIVDRAPDKRQEMMQKSGRHTVPQIWINGSHVGGCDELLALDRQGKLDTMLMGVKS